MDFDYVLMSHDFYVSLPDPNTDTDHPALCEENNVQEQVEGQNTNLIINLFLHVPVFCIDIPHMSSDLLSEY